MAKKSTERARPFLILAGFIALWWILPAGLKVALRSGFGEFQAPAWEATSRGEDLTEYWGHLADSKRTLIEKGRDAARFEAYRSSHTGQADQALLEIKRLRALRSEIRRLESKTNLLPKPRFRYLPARVSRRDLSAWWQTLWLRKGANHGIREGDGVLFSGGVAGRMIEVGARSSVVRLITSPYFRVAAHFEGDERPVTFQGVGTHTFSSPFGLAKDAPTDISPTATSPAELVTSPMSDVFPYGILIGKVPHLQTDPNGLFRVGRVEMDKRLLTLWEVTVLVASNRKESP